jgi:signal transduction histidine kinase
VRYIEIETCSESCAAKLSIRDRGCGIPEESLGKIFNRFYSTRPSGLGMGLAICRRLIESHGGRINARNHESGGAIFSFSLPAFVGQGGSCLSPR